MDLIMDNVKKLTFQTVLEQLIMILILVKYVKMELFQLMENVKIKQKNVQLMIVNIVK